MLAQMPRIALITALLVSFVYAQDVSQPNYTEVQYQAESDAKKDVQKTSAAGWVAGSFVASILFSPILGGGVTVAVAYNTGGVISAPTSNMAVFGQSFASDATAIRVYEDKYESKYAALRKKKQGSAAWKGLLAGWVLNILLISSST